MAVTTHEWSSMECGASSCIRGTTNAAFVLFCSKIDTSRMIQTLHHSPNIHSSSPAHGSVWIQLGKIEKGQTHQMVLLQKEEKKITEETEMYDADKVVIQMMAAQSTNGMRKFLGTSPL
jgi:hypothetical protein